MRSVADTDGNGNGNSGWKRYAYRDCNGNCYSNSNSDSHSNTDAKGYANAAISANAKGSSHPAAAAGLSLERNRVSYRACGSGRVLAIAHLTCTASFRGNEFPQKLVAAGHRNQHARRVRSPEGRAVLRWAKSTRGFSSPNKS